MTHVVSGSVGAGPARRTGPPLGPPRVVRQARHRAPASPVAELVRTIWVRWVPFCALVIGTIARVRQWAGGRSLWLDEVLIADNLVHRGFARLVSEPLAHSQAAPVVWLWLERLAVDVFGSGERALRLVPLLAGIGVTVLTLQLARLVLPRVLVPVPVLLVSLQPSLIYYSNEVKQYSTDTLVVLIVMLLAFKVPVRTDDGKPLRRFAAVAVFAVWSSHAAVFLLAGISVVFVLRPLVAGDLKRTGRVLLCLTPWLVSLLIAYVAVLRPVTQNQGLAEYWQYSFPKGALDLPAWLLRRVYDLAASPLRMTDHLRLLGLGMLAFGFYRLCTHAARSTALLWAAAPLALVAAAISAYPFAGRLALWLVPVAAITLAATLPHRYLRRRTGWLLASTAGLTLISAPAVAIALQQTVQVQKVEELKPLLHKFAQAREPGDLVLVEVATREPFEYYAEQTGVSRDGVILFTVRPPGGPCIDQPALNAGRFATDRVWVISSHRLVDTARLGTVDDMLARIRVVSREVQHLHTTRADAWLFDPSTGPQTLNQVGPRNPERCLTVIRSSR